MRKSKKSTKNDYVLLRPNRRKDLRRHLLVVRVSSAEKNIFFGYAKNISRGGMFIATINPRKIDEEFPISFKFPGDETEVNCLCRVAWTREYDPDSKREPGMGIRFLNLDPDMKIKIDEWAKKAEK
jgi:uncharacterized protein (TIGR02266 family)